MEEGEGMEKLRKEKEAGREKKAEAPLPEAFLERMKKLLGEEYALFLAAYQNPRTQGLRLNELKGEREELEKSCGLYFNLEPIAWAKDGFYYGMEDRPGKHPCHEAGLYYIQEPSAMAVVEALEVKPGERVLDLCAAPGGKSTQIASLLQGQGLLISNEIHPARAKILSQNIERMGAANVAVTNHDARTLALWLPEFFDKIVVDAPCSGEGMFRKEPEARREWTPDSPRQCSLRQQEILEYAAQMLKPGGRLVYSTCTFAPEENEGTVEVFLQKYPEFFIEDSVKEIPGFSAFGRGRPEWAFFGRERQEQADSDRGRSKRALEAAFRLWPHQIRGEGHFLAVFGKMDVGKEKVDAGKEKIGVAEEKRAAGEAAADRIRESNRTGNEKIHVEVSKKKKGKRGENTKMSRGMMKSQEPERQEWEQVFRCFCREIFCTGTWKRVDKEEQGDAGSRFMYFGEQLYDVPEQLPDIRGKKVLRPGLHLGSFKKNRFEPSHALALYLKKEQVKQWISLDGRGEWVIRYLKGETLPIEEVLCSEKRELIKPGNFTASGWILVTVDGYSLGWGKLAGGRLKNHYPKGLRWV